MTFNYFLPLVRQRPIQGCQPASYPQKDPPAQRRTGQLWCGSRGIRAGTARHPDQVLGFCTQTARPPAQRPFIAPQDLLLLARGVPIPSPGSAEIAGSILDLPRRDPRSVKDTLDSQQNPRSQLDACGTLGGQLL